SSDVDGRLAAPVSGDFHLVGPGPSAGATIELAPGIIPVLETTERVPRLPLPVGGAELISVVTEVP
ncbi:MAG: hypothetical protein VCC02_14055, partial [Myxococcota bacterium]